jgi:hypothetical protein
MLVVLARRGHAKCSINTSIVSKRALGPAMKDWVHQINAPSTLPPRSYNDALGTWILYQVSFMEVLVEGRVRIERRFEEVILTR